MRAKAGQKLRHATGQRSEAQQQNRGIAMSQSKAFLVCWHPKRGVHKKISINWNNIVKQCGAKSLQDYVRD